MTDEKLARIIEIVRQDINCLSELPEKSKIFFNDEIEYTEEALEYIKNNRDVILEFKKELLKYNPKE